MNLLIVDDDALVIEALLRRMDWISLGIENVYTAYSVQKAKRIIEEVPVHIILCDIEMPKENGFALMQWVRERQLIVQNIFLTSYAEFEYAKKAIELQSFDYSLKPIAYDALANVVQRAVAAEEEALMAVNYEQIYTYWNDTQKNRKETFWRRLCFEDYYQSTEDIRAELPRLGLKYNTNDLFVPFKCKLFDFEAVETKLGKGMLEFTLRNIYEELFSTAYCQPETALFENRGEWMIIVSVGEEADKQQVYEIIRDFSSKIIVHFKCGIGCVAGETAVIDDISDNCQMIRDLLQKDIIASGSVFIVGEYEYRKGVYEPPNFQLWEAFINEGKENELLVQVNAYLKSCFKLPSISREILLSFIMDYMQMLCSVLKQNHIMLHSLEGAYFSSSSIDKAIQSYESLCKYIRGSIHSCMKMLKNISQEWSVVDRVKYYIDENLDQELFRESLAELVYLNPDYLARLFKKETRESLCNYIANRRIEKAKEYLEKTSDPVNTVAARVGYDNFSYFSKVFKDSVGVTPKDYRKIKI